MSAFLVFDTDANVAAVEVRSESTLPIGAQRVSRLPC